MTLFQRHATCKDDGMDGCGNCHYDIHSQQLPDGRFKVTIDSISAHAEIGAVAGARLAIHDLAAERLGLSFDKGSLPQSSSFLGTAHTALKDDDSYTPEVEAFIKTLKL